MLFLIARGKGEVAINRFGAGAVIFGVRVACTIGSEVVLFAEVAVSGALTKCLRSHIPDTHEFDAIGEEPTEFGFGKPTESIVQCVTVEGGIVGGDGSDVVTVDEREDVSAGVFERLAIAATCGNVGTVCGNFRGVVGRGHEFGLKDENIGNSEGEGFVDAALPISDNSANIVDKRAVDGVGCFSVNDEDVVNAVVHAVSFLFCSVSLHFIDLIVP
jgi:hypothetical protein